MTRQRSFTIIIITLIICISNILAQPTTPPPPPPTPTPTPTPPPRKPLVLHIVPHTHDDSGWLETFDEYYNSDVRSILNTVTYSLQNDPLKTFVWCEIGFLEKWFGDMIVPQSSKDAFKSFVQNKRIEFVGGGYVQHDEACPNADSILLQMTQGFEFITKQFGSQYLPETAWQIDPFGYSAASSSLFSQLGFKQVVINRIKASKKALMKSFSELQFVWRGNPNLKESSDIFTHVLDDHYGPPQQFKDLTIEYPGGPNDTLTPFQLYQLTSFLDSIGRRQSGYYESPHFMLLIGDDFTYSNPSLFNKVDKLKEILSIYYPLVQVKYSTPSEYFKELSEWAKKKGLVYKMYDGDFYTYGDPNDWWTGYYTSRMVLKGLARKAMNEFRVSQYLSSTLVNHSQDFNGDLQKASADISIVQHHDGITGTSVVHVVNDYLTRLLTSMKITTSVSTAALSERYNFSTLEMSDHRPIIDFGDSNVVPVVLYNPLGWKRNAPHSIYVKLPYNSVAINCPVSVWSGDDQQQDCDCLFEEGFAGSMVLRIDWMVEMPASGISTYFIKNQEPSAWSKTNPTGDARPIILPVVYDRYDNPNVLENSMVRVNFNPVTQMAHTFDLIKDNMSMLVDQDIAQYDGVGGSYIFKTFGPSKSITNPNITKYLIGRFRKDVVTSHSNPNHPEPGFSTVVTTRLIEGSSHVFFDYRVRGSPNKDIIVRFNTNFPNPKLYTDDGINSINRHIQYRNLDIAEDYYPSISFAYLEQDNINFICTNDRSRGVSSTLRGGIEFMLHRSCLQDDGKGMREPMIDDSTILTQTQVYFDSSSELARHHALLLENPIKTFLANIHEIGNNQVPNFNIRESLSSELSPNLYMMTLKKMNGTCLFIRLMNINPNQALTVSVDNLVPGFAPTHAQETDLSGFREPSIGSKIQFKYDSNLYFQSAFQTEKRSISAPSLKVQSFKKNQATKVEEIQLILDFKIISSSTVEGLYLNELVSSFGKVCRVFNWMR
ncbi:alpha-mannosidase [Cavenderia fasciculata]|uniref:Alpha-mannosidase n=1 Tax=Cavenderia fasciculata TaxID=261658 RepID=F4QAD8_CACFS|nr:alpha-mannosidase [Cavenderia fasciculata]EGG15657.1 alpha-mannosidase [Cavenderia fasciculata]|eukprot:XP_004354399.1 alpha-mannosidase [Cavenderia fasciculata]